MVKIDGNIGQNKEYFLGIDFGTQGVRCGIVCPEGIVQSVSHEKFNTYYPEPGWAEQNPTDWIDCLCKAAHDCISRVDKEISEAISGISVCATSSTIVPVLEDGTALMDAMVWMDNRAYLEEYGINETKHEVLKYCGTKVSAEWLVPKLLWIKNNRRDVYERSYKIVEQLDYINFFLTGEWVASVCNATCKSNYIENNGKWNRSFFEGIRLGEFSRKLNTDVLHFGEPIAKIRGAVAKKIGLSKNVLVYMGGIDAHTAMIGMGVSKPGDLGIVMGSSFVHIGLSETPNYNPGIWGPYLNAVVPGLYSHEGGQVSAGSIVKWFIREFKVEGEDPYETMIKEAAKVPPGSKGVLALDYFQGNRTPYKDPAATGVFYGLTLSSTRAHIFRAILESVAYGMRNVIEHMTEDNLQINNILACGGVTHNPLWLQIIADVCGKSIKLSTRATEAGITGCAIVAAVGAKLYPDFTEATEKMVKLNSSVTPNMQTHKIYNELYEEYLELYDCLKGFMKKGKKLSNKKTW